MKNPFTALFRVRYKPQDSVSCAPAFYFGTNGSGKPINATMVICCFFSAKFISFGTL